MSTAKELDGLRKFLKKLEQGEMMLSVKKIDVTQREIEILKKEITYLESVLARRNNTSA